MKDELVALHGALYIFRRIGEVLRTFKTDSMPAGKIVHALLDKYHIDISTGTLSNIRDRIEALFRAYRDDPARQYRDNEERLTTVDEVEDYFDHRQGKPFRILKKGWESWGEVSLYFEMMENGRR